MCEIKKVLFIVFLGALSIVRAEGPSVKDNYVVPKAELITYYHGQKPYEIFYPFGWSKNGKFAYFLEERSTPYPVSLQTSYHAIIIDAASSTQVWSFSITKKQESLKDVWLKGDELASLERIWSDFYPVVEPQFTKHKIVQSHQTLHGLPFPGVTKKIKLIVTKEFNDSPGHFFVKEATIKLNEKVIIPPSAISSVSGELDVDIRGYIKSPFAAHFAIVFDTFRMGQHYESVGPYYIVAGTSLEEIADQKNE